MIKILLDHGADKTATVNDMFHPVDLLNIDRIHAKRYLELTQKQRRSCGGSSGGSSYNGSPTPPPHQTLNYLDVDCTNMTPSPDCKNIVYK